MSEIVHLAKLLNLLDQASREADALSDIAPGSSLGRQAAKWQRLISDLQFEVKIREQSRAY